MHIFIDIINKFEQTYRDFYVVSRTIVSRKQKLR